MTSSDGASPPGGWQPLSARLGGTPIDETWQEGIPAWINDSVKEWLLGELHAARVRERLFARLHFDPLAAPVTGRMIDDLDEQALLDWIDGVLHINRNYSSTRSSSGELEDLLREGHSIWKVSDSHDSLERRQDRTVTKAAHKATEIARASGRPAAAARLEEAWSAVYGLHPDPSKAYGQAILAVEAVAVPAIVPTDLNATLGAVRGTLRAEQNSYELAIVNKFGSPSSIDSVVALLSLLWEGHTDRHEGNRPAYPITQDAAEMAVHMAATLVQWFSSGVIRRK